MLLSRTTLALAILIAMSSQASFAQNPAAKVLLEQAQYWKSKGNGERAAEAWKKLLIIDPTDARAMYGLAVIELDASRTDGAQVYLDKIKSANPQSKYLSLLEQDLSLRTPENEKLLYEARLLQESGRADEAVAIYKKLFAGKVPQGDIGLEYYNFLGYATDGWEPSRRGLEALAKESPDNPQIDLAIAKLLSRNGETRADAIERLAKLVTIPSVQSEANEYWRKSLIWLEQPRPSDVPLFEAYLKAHPDDAEISKMLDSARKSEKASSAGNGPAMNPRMMAGFAALDRGDRALAESEFTIQLKNDVKSPDALGGLGLVRFQQNRLEEAQQLLKRAVQNGGQGWNTLLNNVNYLLLLEQARAAQGRGDTAGSRALIQQAIRISPRQPDAMLALGALQTEAGELDAAEKTYRAVLTQKPNDVYALNGLIGVLALNNKLAAAKKLLQNVTPAQVGGAEQMGRLNAAYATGLARSALKRGDTLAAMTMLEDAMKNDRTNPWIRLELAQIYLKQGKSAQAQALFDALLAGDKGDASTLYAGAILSSQRHDWNGTLKLLDRIPTKDRTPDIVALQKSTEAYSQLSVISNLAQQDRKPEALALLNGTKGSMGNSPQMLGAIATTYADMGERARGLDLIQQELALSKRPSPDVMLQYASLLLRTGQDAACAQILSEIKAQTLTNDQNRSFEDLVFTYSVRQADLLRERGDLTDANKRLEPLRAQRPDDLQVIGAQARLYASEGENAKAIDLYNQLIVKSPERVDIRLDAAQIATQVRDLSFADASIQQALLLAPDDADVNAAAARLYLAQGKLSKAQDLFERAMTLQDVPPVTDPRLVAVVGDIGKAQTVQDKAEGAPENFATTPDDASQAAAVPVPATIATELDLIKQERSPEVLLGLQIRNRNGNPGTGKLTDIEAPIELRLPMGDGKFVLQATNVSLNAGTSGSDFYSQSTFGKGLFTAMDPLLAMSGVPDTQTARGTGVSLAYRTRGLTIDAGVTPIGFQYSNFTGGIKFDGMLDQANTMYYALSASTRPVTDSLLSFAGTRDSVTGEAWGGVMASGVRGQLNKSMGGYGFTGSAGFYSLDGHNVASNTRTDASVGTYLNVIKTPDETLTVGVNASSMFYDKNLSNFTYGQGGYFSPQQYYALTLPVNWTQRTGDLSYKFSGAVGVQTFSQNSSDYFPTNSGLQSAANAAMASILANGGGGSGTATYPSQSTTGMAYNLSAASEYRINPYVFLGGTVQLDNASNYRQWGAGVYLRFSFYPRTGPVAVPVSPYASPYGQ